MGQRRVPSDIRVITSLGGRLISSTRANGYLTSHGGTFHWLGPLFPGPKARPRLRCAAYFGSPPTSNIFSAEAPHHMEKCGQVVQHVPRVRSVQIQAKPGDSTRSRRGPVEGRTGFTPTRRLRGRENRWLQIHNLTCSGAPVSADSKRGAKGRAHFHVGQSRDLVPNQSLPIQVQPHPNR